MTPKYTRGWIRMQVMSAMIDIGKWVPGIANSDTELRHSDAVLILGYLLNGIAGNRGTGLKCPRSSGIWRRFSTTIMGRLLPNLLNPKTNPHDPPRQ
ncbi:MAG: hypothetical protein G01um101417_59 [Parcubacteria group bacterium Gr01-1014_17]|nr:MAG: hypothetical protein G01um101417_59 [Parcubacteria group bacterium Gr01-1014_17]